MKRGKIYNLEDLEWLRGVVNRAWVENEMRSKENGAREKTSAEMKTEEPMNDGNVKAGHLMSKKETKDIWGRELNENGIWNLNKGKIIHKREWKHSFDKSLCSRWKYFSSIKIRINFSVKKNVLPENDVAH